jgi:hypothetical protein
MYWVERVAEGNSFIVQADQAMKIMAPEIRSKYKGRKINPAPRLPVAGVL